MEGSIETINKNFISGWAKQKNRMPVRIHLLIDGKKAASVIADIFDAKYVFQKVQRNGNCGFRFNIKNLNIAEKSRINIQLDSGQELANSPFSLKENPLNKLFFLHIPKTAGTSVNEILASHFSSGKVKTHIESYPDLKNFTAYPIGEKYDFISGHLNYYRAHKLFYMNVFKKITLLRNPFEQLVSHFRWLYFVAEDQNSSFFKNHTEIIKQIALRIRGIDFSNNNQVKHYINNLNIHEKTLFDNCQTRYLLHIHNKEKLTEEDADQALETLLAFDVVGTVENLPDFFDRVYNLFGWEFNLENIAKKNENTSVKHIDINNPELSELLKPLIRHDQLLYESIRIRNEK